MIEGRILKTRRCGSASRYLGVTLTTGKIKRYALVHRLVAQTFLPNPCELPEINHKDCCGSNNAVDNLEWCDRKYNINYADRTAKAAEACEKKVECIETGEKFASITKAASAKHLLKSKISQVCNGKRTTTGGLHWRFVLTRATARPKRTALKA